MIREHLVDLALLLESIEYHLAVGGATESVLPARGFAHHALANQASVLDQEVICAGDRKYVIYGGMVEYGVDLHEVGLEAVFGEIGAPLWLA